MAYSDIIARLKSDIESVSGITNVFDYKPRVVDDHKRLERLKGTDNRLHWWQISREESTDITDYLTLVVPKDDYIIQGWYALDDSDETEKTFQALVDGVRTAIDQDRLLNGYGYVVDPVTISPITEEMKTNVLCHTAKVIVRILTTIDCS